MTDVKLLNENMEIITMADSVKRNILMYRSDIL